MKSRFKNGIHPFWQCDRFQAGTAIESICFDFLHIFGNGDGSQHGALFKSAFSNLFEAGKIFQLIKRPDFISRPSAVGKSWLLFKHMSQVGDGSSLPSTQFTVAILIPVGDTFTLDILVLKRDILTNSPQRHDRQNGKKDDILHDGLR